MQAKPGQLYYLVGIKPAEVGNHTADLLPTFWRDFEIAREKTHLVRALIENDLNTNWPGWAPMHWQFIGTLLVSFQCTLEPLEP